MKSTKEVSRLIGISIRQVNNYAVKMGIKKIGSSHGFTELQIKKIREQLGKLGRPKKVGKS